MTVQVMAASPAVGRQGEHSLFAEFETKKGQA